MVSSFIAPSVFRWLSTVRAEPFFLLHLFISVSVALRIPVLFFSR